MKPVFLFLTFLVLFFGCSDDDSVSTRHGVLQLFLTDQPVELQEVWVTITNIEVHKTGGGWIRFDASSETLDLLTLENRTQLLQSAPLEPGKYTGIRLVVSEGHTIAVDGERCELKVPSEKIHVPLNFSIENETETAVVLDFDAKKSIHVVQTGNNERCILRPVIQVTSVTNPEN